VKNGPVFCGAAPKRLNGKLSLRRDAIRVFIQSKWWNDRQLPNTDVALRYDVMQIVLLLEQLLFWIYGNEMMGRCSFSPEKDSSSLGEGTRKSSREPGSFYSILSPSPSLLLPWPCITLPCCCLAVDTSVMLKMLLTLASTPQQLGWGGGDCTAVPFTTGRAVQ